jgi:ABC-type transport system involved in multi-copper enzyme maturation permease subunit
MNTIVTIAKKEFTDAFKDKLFLTLLLFLVALSIMSIVVASNALQSKVIDYQNALKLLKSLGNNAQVMLPPKFYPLQLLRGVVDYIEIIGAVLGIVLGFLSIAKEKGKKTLQLVLTRPIKRSEIMAGKLISNSLLILLVLSVVFVIVYGVISLLGGVSLTQIEVVKLLLTFVFSFIYIMIFFSLASLLSLIFKSLPNALIVCFTVWLVFVLVLPQIGDTMDPDNQIPGGFFKSINFTKPQEKEVLARFSHYETIRNIIEESSITKHYERMSFALLGIKDQYNDQSLTYIFSDRWNDAVWQLAFLFGFASLVFFLFSNNERLLLE